MSAMAKTHALRLSRRMKAVAEPNRLQLLSLIAARPGCTQAELVAWVGRLSQPSIAGHLRILRATGAVQAKRAGVFFRYTLDDDGLDRLADAVGGLAR